MLSCGCVTVYVSYSTVYVFYSMSLHICLGLYERERHAPSVLCMRTVMFSTCTNRPSEPHLNQSQHGSEIDMAMVGADGLRQTMG